MPLYREDAPPVPKKPDVIAAWKPGLKTAVIDTRYTPQSDLLAYIEGSTWVVDYYSQILDAHDELGGQDASKPAPLQQYKRIWSMELKVTQDLAQITPDQATAEITLQGSANVYPFLTPQIGDMFRAGIADGREGLFKIIRSEPRQIFAEAAHVIEYQLIAINDPQRIYDLNEKTIATYYFVKDFLLNLQNPLLIEEDYKASRSLEAYWHDLIQLYFSQYFSREFMTLLVPGQGRPVYDHGLTEFVKDLMDSKEDVHIQSIRQLNVGEDGALKSNSLWTMLSRRDPKLFKFIYTKTALTSTGNYHRSGMMAGIRFSAVSQVVYPIDPQLPVDFELGQAREKPLGAGNVESKWAPITVIDPQAPTKPSPLVVPIDFEDGYVLSAAFYRKDRPKCSLLEQLLLDYLDFKLIASRDVLKLCDDSYEWGHVERFYYFPLLILLIKYNLRRL